ncbi:MAG: hypothetical protein ACREIW_00810 [Chthoniobacterales bacterium]
MNKIAVAALTAIVGLGFQQAKADFVFNLTVGNSAISGYPAPYAQVDVNLTSSTMATVTFTSLLNSGNIYLFGAVSSVDVNVNATAFTLTGITGSNAGTGFSPGIYSQGSAGNVSQFGVFNGIVDSFDGYTHSSDNISFTLTNTSGTWATAASVLAPNSSGNLAAAHIFVATSPADASNGALATGFAASVPEPSATLLVPLGGILAFLWRLRTKR